MLRSRPVFAALALAACGCPTSSRQAAPPRDQAVEPAPSAPAVETRCIQSNVDVRIERHYRNGRLVFEDMVNDAGAWSYVARIELDDGGRAVREVVDTSESIYGPSLVRSTFSYAYDRATRTLRVTRTPDEGEPSLEVWTFTADGRVASFEDEDPEGEPRRTDCVYEATRLFSRETEDSLTTYTYDAEGRLASYVSGRGLRTLYTIARTSDGTFTVTQRDEDGEPLEEITYDGACDDVLFDPCTSSAAPPFPGGASP